MNRKCFWYWIAALPLLVVLASWWVNVAIKKQTAERIFDDVAALPQTDVALVLGTSPRRPDGYRNLFFEYRIAAAAELYHSGKVKHLLVSGANPSVQYNEPKAMQASLMLRDVPEDAITLDYAGLRTLDSIVRAKQIFGQQRLIIVSQEFHLYRALYQADHFGIEAVAFKASKVPIRYARKVYIREFMARVKALIDLKITGKQPRFLGEAEPIQLGIDRI
jgi:SanA protein